jgi:hypothetical protein
LEWLQNVKCWYIIWSSGIFYDHQEQFVIIWCIFPILVYCLKKNLATLPHAEHNVGQTSVWHNSIQHLNCLRSRDPQKVQLFPFLFTTLGC